MPDVAESFFEHSGGDLYVASELTRGPWDPGSQHAGPPAALIGREVERLGGGLIGGEGGAPAHLGRITYEVMRPVPIGPVRVSAEILRPGRRVEMFGASLVDESGTELIRAQGWRIATSEISFEEPPGVRRQPPGPEAGGHRPFPETGHDVGYHAAVEYRFVEGAFREPGPAVVWMRMKVPLLPDEEPTPLTRLLVVADSGNGVSAALDWSRYLFINVDLSVHLNRMPEGEWVCLDAVTLPERNGIGIADTALFDQRGRVGRAAQTLLVRPAERR
jgi:Acyl-CoA thioesterase C-terminal domain/Acyl-CoA thioesterase N-terminal domain